MNDVFFDHATIDAWIAEDAPLLDLTTHLLAIGKQAARIQFTVRHDTVAACTEEAARKHAPGLRRIALKATLSGGAFPHRLGVGETVLIFPQHRALVGDWHTLQTRLSAAAPALAEKKCVIEVQSLDDAFAAIHAGADVLQFDKVTHRPPTSA